MNYFGYFFKLNILYSFKVYFNHLKFDLKKIMIFLLKILCKDHAISNLDFLVLEDFGGEPQIH